MFTGALRGLESYQVKILQWSALYGSLKPGHRRPVGVQVGRTRAADPQVLGGSRPLSTCLGTQTGCVQPGFPVVLRNYFAGVVFALIVPGAVFVYGALPAAGQQIGEERDISVAAHPGRRAPSRSQGDRGQKEAKVSATPGSPQPSPGVLLATDNQYDLTLL